MFLISFHIFKLASKILRKQFYLKTKNRKCEQYSNIGDDIISRPSCSGGDLCEQEMQNENLIYLQQFENLDVSAESIMRYLNIYFDSLFSSTGCTKEEYETSINDFEKFIPNFDELIITNYKFEDQVIIFLDDVVKRLVNCSYTALFLPLETREINNSSNSNNNNNTVSIVNSSDVQNVMKKNKKRVKKLKRM